MILATHFLGNDLTQKKMSRVAYALEGVNLREKADWDKMMDFLIDNMIKLEKAMKQPLIKVKRKLNEKEDSE